MFTFFCRGENCSSQAVCTGYGTALESRLIAFLVFDLTYQRLCQSIWTGGATNLDKEVFGSAHFAISLTTNSSTDFKPHQWTGNELQPYTHSTLSHSILDIFPVFFFVVFEWDHPLKLAAQPEEWLCYFSKSDLLKPKQNQGPPPPQSCLCYCVHHYYAINYLTATGNIILEMAGTMFNLAITTNTELPGYQVVIFKLPASIFFHYASYANC